MQRLRMIDEALEMHLRAQREHFDDASIRYVDAGKNVRQLHIKRATLRRTPAPASFTLVSETQDAQRFYNEPLRQLVAQRQDAEDDQLMAVRAALKEQLDKFCERFDDFVALTRRICDVDCLLSLARASQVMSEPCCRPVLRECKLAKSATTSAEGGGGGGRGEASAAHGGASALPYFKATQFRHPCLAERVSGPFIANDLHLGRGTPGDDAATDVIVLTGPNMGGKSTLLRQTCLATILAQVGAYVPAAHFELTPVDRIFTRIGASDNLLAGQSTFLTELIETAAVLNKATPHSLVILDELGRGTSTQDGVAIASAVLEAIAERIQCRTLFSTHLCKMNGRFCFIFKK
jgi:DNA mismatch repair protein MSH6